MYSLLPQAQWKALRLKPLRRIEFVLADGTPLERGVSEANFEIGGLRATSPVVLGDEPLLGAMRLGSLGMMLDPLRRRLVPMRMLLLEMAEHAHADHLQEADDVLRRKLGQRMEDRRRTRLRSARTHRLETRSASVD